MPIRTSTVTLRASGQDFQSYFAEPETGGPGILLLHAWWGLKPFFKQVADRLAEQGFIVIAPDLRQGRIAQTIEEATTMNEQSDQQLMGETITAAKNYLLHYPVLKGEKIGVMGFSLGAAWAMVMAARDPGHIGAAVLFYGANSVDFSKVRAKVLGHFSDVDEWEPYDDVMALEGRMKAAGVDVTFQTYPGMAHWFVEEDRPEYNADAAGLAWDRTIEFLKANVKPIGTRM